MSRRYHNKSTDSGTFIVFLIILATIEIGYYHKETSHVAPIIIGCLITLILLKFTLRLRKRIKLRRQAVTLQEVDYMSGLEFEQYIANLLRKHDFKKVSLTEKYDMGVDIIAEKNGQRWGIQTKRYSGLVKAEAVRQVIAGLNSYKCDKSMVITNSTFSKYAIKLAQSNHCILIDRMELAKLISENPKV